MKQPLRILTAILVTIVVGVMCAHDTVKQNDPAYQQHPITCIITDFFGASLSGLIFYFGSGWLAKRKERKANLKDDKSYDQVASELQNNNLIPGLWTKAFAEMNGDDAKARALYIRYRVQQLRNKAELEKKAEQARSRDEAKNKRLAAEAAKPPLKWYDELATFLLAIICGCLTFLMIGFLANTRYVCTSISGEDGAYVSIVDVATVYILIGSLACIFGWITYKCAKAVCRNMTDAHFSKVNRLFLMVTFITPLFAGLFGFFGGLHPFYGPGRKGVIFQSGFDASFSLWTVTTALFVFLWIAFLIAASVFRKTTAAPVQIVKHTKGLK